MAYSNKNTAGIQKIFKLHRLKFEELWDDALAYVRETYGATREDFTVASPFFQLLSVILHLGRMILYYIEDSITGLNIRTAYRPEQIRGLATLTGHDPGRSISARGGVKIVYNNNADPEYKDEVIYISNKTKVINNATGLEYVLLFSADNARMSLSHSNEVNGVIVQGTMKYKQATGTGLALQSFNFTESNYEFIDQYFVNVYVNGEPWEVVSSLLDLGYNQKGVVVRTGQIGGIDVFFGNMVYGAVPPMGATILVEYLVTAGSTGNWSKDIINAWGNGSFWEFEDEGFLKDGSTVDLNELFIIESTTDIIFGTDMEDITLTQRIAPYASRSMVLGNEKNYEYFLKKMGMFSVIKVIPGYTLSNAFELQKRYASAFKAYQDAFTSYQTYLEHYGKTADATIEKYKVYYDKERELSMVKKRLDDAQLSNNTVYLMLVPDISKRIGGNSNYYSCSLDLFKLTDDEKTNILDAIEASGQRVLTVENRILDPKQPKFAVNVSVRLWEDYTYMDLYNSALPAMSNYFLTNDRRDRIPISDIIALFESLDEVDSVSASFDADINNQQFFGKGNYGIDDFGDIVLSRKVLDNSGNYIEVQDIYPLFRGGFTSKDGVTYSDTESPYELSGLNISVIGSSVSMSIPMTEAVPYK